LNVARLQRLWISKSWLDSGDATNAGRPNFFAFSQFLVRNGLGQESSLAGVGRRKPCLDMEGRINKANLTAGNSKDTASLACGGGEVV